jgi:hypothetical protein
MISLLTDTTTNDLYLDAKGNLAISTSRIEAIRQLIQNKLQTFLGEIAINLDEGVDYFGIVLDNTVPLQAKLIEISNKILEVEGVVGITNSDYSLNDSKTEATFDLTIQTDVGNINLSDLTLLV